jgi:hypothetical protein
MICIVCIVVVVYFRLITNDIDGLCKNAHLFLTVWDYDMTNDDDLIGGVAIPFSAIFQVSVFAMSLYLKYYLTNPYHIIIQNLCAKKQYKFELDLLRNGLVHGTIEGVITIANSKTSLRDEFIGSPEPEERISLYEDSLRAAEKAHHVDPNSFGCNCSIS